MLPASSEAAGSCNHNGQRDCYATVCVNHGFYLVYYTQFPNNPAWAKYQSYCGVA
jgi:hypothetical protein